MIWSLVYVSACTREHNKKPQKEEKRPREASYTLEPEILTPRGALYYNSWGSVQFATHSGSVIPRDTDISVFPSIINLAVRMQSASDAGQATPRMEQLQLSKFSNTRKFE